jgi:hypothetical protein
MGRLYSGQDGIGREGEAIVSVTKREIKVLAAVYRGTDCCNEVYDYATLHYSQRMIADELKSRGLMTSEVCLEADGDGFSKEPERWSDGYRLTTAGYEALTAHSPDGYPPSHRRFAEKVKP